MKHNKILTFFDLGKDIMPDEFDIVKDYPFIKDQFSDFRFKEIEIIKFLTEHLHSHALSHNMGYTWLDAIYITPISILASGLTQREMSYIDIVNYYYKLYKLTKCSANKYVNKISRLVNQIYGVLQYQCGRFKLSDKNVTKTVENVVKECNIPSDDDVNKLPPIPLDFVDRYGYIKSLGNAMVCNVPDSCVGILATEHVLSEIDRESKDSSLLKNESVIKKDMNDESTHEPVNIFKKSIEIIFDLLGLKEGFDKYQYKSFRDNERYDSVMESYCDSYRIIGFLRKIQSCFNFITANNLGLIEIPISVIKKYEGKCALIDIIDYYYNIESVLQNNIATRIQDCLIKNCKFYTLRVDNSNETQYPEIEDVFHKTPTSIRYRILKEEFRENTSELILSPVAMVSNTEYNNVIITQITPENQSKDDNTLQYQFRFGSMEYEETDRIMMTTLNLIQSNTNNNKYIIDTLYKLDDKYAIDWIALESYNQSCKIKVAYCERANGTIGISIEWPFGIESLLSTLLSGDMRFVLTITLKDELSKEEE